MASMFCAFLLAVTVLLRCCPKAPMACYLQNAVVARFCQWLDGLSRRHIIYAVIVVGLLLTAGELVAMLGSTDLLFAYALDLSFYADALIASAGLAAMARGARVALTLRKSRAARVFRRPQAARRRRSVAERAQAKPPVNDDDRPPHHRAA